VTGISAAEMEEIGGGRWEKEEERSAEEEEGFEMEVAGS
jgi:hypothetical protein